MTRYKLIPATLSLALLVGCGLGESRLNPLNWFGSGTETETAPDIEIVTVTDNRPLVQRVTALKVDRTPGGAIIRVTGLPPQQGWYDITLVNETPEGASGSTLFYSLRGRPPAEPTRVSTTQSREVTAAVFLSNTQLDRIREIRVTGVENSQSARR